MKVDLLNQLGLSNIDYSYIFISMAAAILVLFIILIIQAIQLNKMNKRYVKFMGGKDVKSLEEQIERILKENEYLKELSEDNKKEIKKIKVDIEKFFSKVGIVKYDAFKQMGGNLSFSLCMLNENNNGFIMNSVHSTEGCYTYIKEITAGVCELELSNEEKEALIHAMKS